MTVNLMPCSIVRDTQTVAPAPDARARGFSMPTNPIGINPMCIRVSLDMEDLAAAITMYLQAQSNPALKGAIDDITFTDGDGDEVYPEEITVVLDSAEEAT
jgi:hypothetical protein